MQTMYLENWKAKSEIRSKNLLIFYVSVSIINCLDISSCQFFFLSKGPWLEVSDLKDGVLSHYKWHFVGHPKVTSRWENPVMDWYFVSNIVLTYCEKKNVLVIEKNFWNLRLKAENLQKKLDHQNILFEQWKVRPIFGTECFFNLFLEVSQI